MKIRIVKNAPQDNLDSDISHLIGYEFYVQDRCEEGVYIITTNGELMVYNEEFEIVD